MTRHYTYATLYGDKVLCRGWDDKEGGYFNKKYSYKPTFYLKTDKPTEYKTLDGIPVAPVKPGTIKESKAFLKQYSDVAGITVYGMDRILYQFLSDEFAGTVDYDPEKIKLWSLDIETAADNGFPNIRSADQEVLLISVKNFHTKNIYTFGCGNFENKDTKVRYVQCKDEKHLLLTFLSWWKKEEPEVITGWNVEGFDIPYLYNRIDRVLSKDDADSLSPWNFIIEREVEINNRVEQRYDIIGVSVIDYMLAYKKYRLINRESYRLDAIAEVELNENKLDHSEYSTFKEFYTKDWQKFTEYNIHDVNLVDKLEEKLKYISIIMFIAYDSHCNYGDTFHQVRLWDVIIYNFLKDKNIVLSPTKQNVKTDKYTGAYVKDPVPGGYDWIVNYDLNSLYPSLIRFLNISPETITDKKIAVNIDKLIQKECKIELPADLAVAANGCTYRKDKIGFMAELVTRIYDERVQYKDNMIACKKEYEKNPSPKLSRDISKWNNYQMARKIQLNSLYGALGNQYFRHYRLDNAEAITLTGRVAIRWIERKLNEYLNMVQKTKDFDYVIAVDTDSVYLNLGPLVASIKQQIPGDYSDPTRIVDLLDSFSEDKIIPFINKSYEELAKYLNAFENALEMKREAIAERGIWAAKKRYILNVWDNEGVRFAEPELKMIGFEAKKSSTPAPCRKYIEESLNIFMRGTEDELIQYIKDKRKEFKSLSPSEIAFPRTANNISKFVNHATLFNKGTPQQVRGAIVYNHMIRKHNLTHKYPIIMDGEKLRYVYLKLPNPSKQNVIAFLNDFPEELNLTKYIDYDTMYQKAFIDPLQAIMNSVGWHTEKQITLKSFFV